MVDVRDEVKPTTSQAAKFADGLERSLWTVAEAAGATGIVAGFQALPLFDIPTGYLPLAIILVAGVLAGIKSSVAQKWGNGSAATLPDHLEPVPADRVVAQETGSGLVVAGYGATPTEDGNVSAGTPVEVEVSDELGEVVGDELPDVGEDLNNEGLEPPEDFDDGSDIEYGSSLAEREALDAELSGDQGKLS